MDTKNLTGMQVGELILNPEDLVQKLETSRGIFEVKIAEPLTKKLIIRNVTASLGHAPVNSVPATDYYFVTAVETVRAVVVDSPDWFTDVDSCKDDELIMDLYDKYTEFEIDFRGRLRKNKFRKHSK